MRGERKGCGREPTEEAPGTAARRGEGFTFLGSAEAAYLFKEPQGKPFGQTVKFLNCLLPWCLNKLPPRLPGRSQEGGRPLFLLARHSAPCPSPGGPRPGLLLRPCYKSPWGSPVGSSLGQRAWAPASGRAGLALATRCPRLPARHGLLRPAGGRAGGLGRGSQSLSWFLRFSQLSQQSSNKNLKGSVAQRVCETPLWNQLAPTDLSQHLITASATETSF